jgi:ribosomal protein L11 methyltransferase
MPVYKAEFIASQTLAESLASLMAETIDPPPAISVSEAPGGRLISIYFEERPDPAIFDMLAETWSPAAILRDLTLAVVPDENWVEKSQRDLPPIEAGRFFIYASHDRPRAKGKACAIQIDAGLAFGTAHHGTTRGCLLMLDRLAKQRWARRALDLGTGSGILAIAAAKSLCGRVLASDIDPVAVSVASGNIRENGVLGRVAAITAAGLRHRRIAGESPFDLVTANILAGPLNSLAPAILRIKAPAGHQILSGLIDSQAREVSAHYLAQGFRLVSRLSLEGWTTLCLRAGMARQRKKPPGNDRQLF